MNIVSREIRPAFDVVIAGAGPSGLTVATEAALGGSRVLVLEKRNGPTWTRAGTIAPRVMEIFESRGLADRFLRRAAELHSNPHAAKGIWAGLPGIEYEALETDYRSVMMFPQIETEKLLAERAKELGVEVRLGCEFLEFDEGPEGIEVRYRDAQGALNRIRTSYLVGADGGRSTVRHAAGIAFNGMAARRIAVNVDAKLPNPFDKTLVVDSNENGWAMTYPLRKDLTRFAFIDAATMFEGMESVLSTDRALEMLERVHGTDYGITEVDAINRFHDALYRAERMRKGRVFLVGEAVRIHYPAAGVGMNFCIQDAFNLGWKLAAVTAHGAPEDLLDTYEAERGPEVDALLESVRTQCAVQFGFDRDHLSLKQFLQRQIDTDVAFNRRIAEFLSGLSARYTTVDGAHPLVGVRLPNLRLANGKRLFEMLGEQRFVYIDLAGDGKAVPRLAAEERVTVVSAKSDHRALRGLAAVLVRPDGHVAWASDEALDESSPDAKLRHWLAICAPGLASREADSRARPQLSTFPPTSL